MFRAFVSLSSLFGGVEVLKLERCLPAKPYAESCPELLTRKTTRTAWKAIFQVIEKEERVAMLGIPGIGKSRSLALGLWYLIGKERPDWVPDWVQPKVIVWEAREGGRVFFFMKNSNGQWKARSQSLKSWDSGACKYLQDEKNWYLVDTYGKQDTLKLAAKTVKACSPDPEHYSNFIKDGRSVYVEAWNEEELREAYPYLHADVELDVMVKRFQQVGGNLRALLRDQDYYQKQLEAQRTQADDFKQVKNALLGDIDTPEKKISTRLFTYKSENGTDSRIVLSSAGAEQVLIETQYAKLMEFCCSRDEKSNYWFEEFAGVFLRSSAWAKETLKPYSITDTSTKSPNTQLPQPFATPFGYSLEEIATPDLFEQQWKEAVQQKSLGKRLLRCPNNYPGIDYLLDFNHGIQVTNAMQHSIAPRFVEKLKSAFAGVPGQNFTLTFLITGDAKRFKLEKKAELENLMQMTEFHKIHVQAIQVPKSLQKEVDDDPVVQNLKLLGTMSIIIE